MNLLDRVLNEPHRRPVLVALALFFCPIFFPLAPDVKTMISPFDDVEMDSVVFKAI